MGPKDFEAFRIHILYLFGEDSQFDEHIFLQMGWFNHQPDTLQKKRKLTQATPEICWLGKNP